MPADGHSMSEHHHEHHQEREGQAYHYDDYGGRSYHGKAVAAIILGALGFLIPLVPSILAILLGHSARREVREQPQHKGEGLATTGLILGWAALVLFALGVLALVLLVTPMPPLF